ncbi:hypothetical protein [Umezakia ovalisporum]|uniref:hypothetical protein n=1 Tax=Umezakia ovalisporum TaxID=75695 RepID=UPI0039C626D4
MQPDNNDLFSDRALRDKLTGFEPPLPAGGWQAIKELQAQKAKRPQAYLYTAALFLCLSLYLGYAPNYRTRFENFTPASITQNQTVIPEINVSMPTISATDSKTEIRAAQVPKAESDYVNTGSKRFKKLLAGSPMQGNSQSFSVASSTSSVIETERTEVSEGLALTPSKPQEVAEGLEQLNPELRQATLQNHHPAGLEFNDQTQTPNASKPSLWDTYKREFTLTPRLVTGLYHPDNATNLLVLPANQQQDSWRFRNAFQVSFSLTRDLNRAFLLAGVSMQSIHETVNIRLDLPASRLGTPEPGMRTTDVKLDANYLFAGLRAGGGYWLDKSKRWRTGQVFTFSRLMRGSARFIEEDAVISSLRFPAAEGANPTNLVWSTSAGYHHPIEGSKAVWFIEPGVSYMLYSNTPKNQPGSLKPFMVDIHLGLRW